MENSEHLIEIHTEVRNSAIRRNVFAAFFTIACFIGILAWTWATVWHPPIVPENPEYLRDAVMDNPSDVNGTEHFWYKRLSDHSKEVYDALDVGIRDFAAVHLPSETSEYELCYICAYYLIDNPDVYWLETPGDLSYHADDDGYIEWVVPQYSLGSRIVAEDTARIEQTEEDLVKTVRARIKQDMDPVEATLITLADSLTYDKGVYANQGVYSMLYDRRGVCAGYAKECVRILRQVDVPAVVVLNDGMTHAWIAVFDDEGNAHWYDPTWFDRDVSGEYNWKWVDTAQREFLLDHPVSEDTRWMMNLT